MSAKTLEIIRAISQAAANAYDGAHDERYTSDGKGWPQKRRGRPNPGL